jgi:3-methyladenine DNA glycosylase AlkD
MVEELRSELARAADPEKARSLAWFFKTGKGQYGEGDKFLGLTVPQQRRVARKFRRMALGDIATMLSSEYHEHRFTALEILVAQYENGDDKARKEIFDFYLAHTRGINNWDLVDTSAPYIVGDYLRKRSRRVLYRLAKSKNLWERRIAMVSTLGFIRDGDCEDTLAIAELLLGDQHDLIHKAMGWMLREAGKQEMGPVLAFLERHYHEMPRTALRYAIERLPPARRRAILAGRFT